jgi:uncharacterized protein (UPF0248 family)
MTRRRGDIEDWLKRVFFGGDREKYVIYVRYREGGKEELIPIPASLVKDIRGGYIYVGDTMIPYHRVEEIRDRDGNLLFKRSRKKT